MDLFILIFVVLIAFLGLFVVFLLSSTINKGIISDEKANFITGLIRKGAFSFLRAEYKVISWVVLLLSLLLYLVSSLLVVLFFVLGSCLSLFVGFIGMNAATKANGLTSMAAKEKGEHEAFLMAFRGGGIMGFAVSSIGLLGLSLVFWFSYGKSDFELLLSAFALGASLVAFFARVGGGIYTKSADVGADLVGKLEAGIPEDDPRNPAVIADNVGDCVGDTAGMGADIYESYIASMVSAIILGFYQLDNFFYTVYPLLISGLGLIASIISIAITFSLKLNSKSMLKAATVISVASFLIISFIFSHYYEDSYNYFFCLAIGCLSGLFVGAVTEYYTSGDPVKQIAKSSESGAATNIIYGLSVGMESTFIPIVGLSISIYIAFLLGGSYGVAMAAVAMLSTVAIIMTIDGYGPIADNAGGISEMSHFGTDIRKITDHLDALGNTTAAVGKGFAIGSALLASLGVFSAYAEKAGLDNLNLIDTVVLLGIFVGASTPFLISAYTMRSVGNAALDMVKEVRRQFKEIPGIMQGLEQPDYEKCIEISTKASLREMILPGFITIFLPIFMKYVLGIKALGGFLVGATISGVLLSLMMANGGGAFDNAKKYIESGAHGGKGSDAHKAAIVGDTLGDPFKDTSGPSLNILIKLMSMISLLLVSL